MQDLRKQIEQQMADHHTGYTFRLNVKYPIVLIHGMDIESKVYAYAKRRNSVLYFEHLMALGIWPYTLSKAGKLSDGRIIELSQQEREAWLNNHKIGRLL